MSKSLVGTICEIIHNIDWPRPDTDTTPPENKNAFWFPPRELDKIGKLVIVDSGGPKEYSVQFLDSGHSSAWWKEGTLKYVREATNADRELANKRLKDNQERDSSLAWHLAKYDSGDTNVSMSIVQILKKHLKLECVFEKTGEYYDLFMEFGRMLPLIKAVFDGTEFTQEELDKLFIKEGHESIRGLLKHVKETRQSELYKRYIDELK